MDEVKDIVKRYRGEQSLDDYADVLSEAFHPYRRIRRQHVSNWEQGTNPELFAMIYLRDNAKGEVARMAQEVISVLLNS